MSDKQKLQVAFNRLYPNCELYHITINGFSNTVFYKDKNGQRHIDAMSLYSPEQHTVDYHDEGGNIESFNEDRTKVLFMGFGHGSRQDFDYCQKPWC